MALDIQNVLTVMDQVKGSLVILLTWHNAYMILSRNLDLEMHFFNFALSVFRVSPQQQMCTSNTFIVNIVKVILKHVFYVNLRQYTMQQ